MKKRILSLVVLCAVLVSCCVPAFAAECPTDSAENSTIGGPAMRRTSRDYTQFYTQGTRLEVMQDSNWAGSRVTVSLKSNQGPTGFHVEIHYWVENQFGGGEWELGSSGTVSSSTSLSSSIPTGATFIVMATQTSGSNGNATFTVTW
jgi:hypothetical protein